MDARKKLMELLDNIYLPMMDGHNTIGEYIILHKFKEKIVDYLITNGVMVQEWISANEPPKDTCEYWIAYKAGGDYSYSTGYFDGKCWCSALTHHKIPVTHWMPLPHPPKGE